MTFKSWESEALQTTACHLETIVIQREVTFKSPLSWLLQFVLLYVLFMHHQKYDEISLPVPIKQTQTS